MNDKDPIERLRAANPVPDASLTPSQQARAEEDLRRIMANGETPKVVSLRSRRGPFPAERNAVLAGVAAAAVLAVVGVAVPGVLEHSPQASAAEILRAAGATSALQDDASSTGATNQAYLKRVDTVGETIRTTEFEAPQGAEPTAVTHVEGPPSPLLSGTPALPVSAQELSQADTPDKLVALAGDTPRGLVELLAHPSLTSAQHKMVYEALATKDIQLLGDGEIATFRAGDLTFKVRTHTGQLVQALNLVAPGVSTEIQATAILGCVATKSLEGPAEISLGCADDNYVLRDIVWSDWGADTATATATAVINDCDPYCAEGTYRSFPVTVTVNERKECGYNAKLYSRLEVASTNSSLNSTYNIGCAL